MCGLERERERLGDSFVKDNLGYGTYLSGIGKSYNIFS
jgi:hypothetical protein